jgi:hypothetical protein
MLATAMLSNSLSVHIFANAHTYIYIYIHFHTSHISHIRANTRHDALGTPVCTLVCTLSCVTKVQCAYALGGMELLCGYSCTVQSVSEFLGLRRIAGGLGSLKVTLVRLRLGCVAHALRSL